MTRVFSLFATLLLAVLAGVGAAEARWTSEGDAEGAWMRQAFSAERGLATKSLDSDKPQRMARKSREQPASWDDESRPQRRSFKSAAPKYEAAGSSSSFQSGIASYYWQPQRVASGGWFNPNAMTAAHKTLPFGTRVRVTNHNSGRSVVVTINDRGPYVAGRVIDLSSAAAGAVGMKGAGLARVSLSVLGR